jgi:hypothetical protein
VVKGIVEISIKTVANKGGKRDCGDQYQGIYHIKCTKA